MGSTGRWSAAVLGVVWLVSASPAGAQYFGRNKVQYRSLSSSRC